jgi:anti-sigma B factor antagonist
MAYFNTEKLGEVTVVRFMFNELSLEDREKLKMELEQLLSGSDKFVFNMSKVGFVSSLLIAAIVFFAKRAAAKKASVNLACCSQAGKDVLHIARMDKIFKMYETETEALQNV